MAQSCLPFVNRHNLLHPPDLIVTCKSGSSTEVQLQLFEIVAHFWMGFWTISTELSIAVVINMNLLCIRCDSPRPVTPLATRCMPYVGAIRDVAAGDPTVGQDCMSIQIPNPRHRKEAIIRFIPVEQRQSRISPSHLPVYDLPFAFSPWIVGSRHTYAPSVFSARAVQLRVNGWTIELDVPLRSPGRGIQAVVHSARRRPAPG